MEGKIIVLLLVLKTVLLPRLAQATYTLEVRAHSYQNSDHEESDGGCCDFLCGQCDNRFVFCLRRSSTANDGNPGNCPLGRYSTGDIGDDSFSFSTPIASGVPNPLTFTGSVWPRTVRLFIEVMDDDPLNSDDHIDDIYVTITKNPGSSYSSRGSYTGIHGNSRIELSFRVQCGTNYYGSNCATYCVARDDSRGHYTCGTNGQKICRSGWSSSYCTTPICSSGCHPVGGYCNRPRQCLCNSGWTGSNCGTCVPSQGCSSMGGYCNLPGECICRSGYSGSNCDVDLLPCERQSPCQNGATCSNDGRGGYSCSCSPGYQGTNCQSEINECLSNPCQNGGTCTDRVNGFDCQCAPGYHGDQCETERDECASNPCQNAVRCHDRVNGYFCECVTGFNGTNCENEVDECASSPCMHGRCQDNVGSYSCACEAGWTGTNCDVNINDYTPAASSDAVPVSAGVGVATVVVVLIILVALVGIVACMKRRKSDQNDPSLSYYDNAADNPVYGLGTLDGNSTLSGDAGVKKVEKDPCPLYDELDNLNDGLYMDMKPAVDSKSPPPSYDYVKVEGQKDKGPADVVHVSEA